MLFLLGSVVCGLISSFLVFTLGATPTKETTTGFAVFCIVGWAFYGLVAIILASYAPH